jgi:hypothetical protein
MQRPQISTSQFCRASALRVLFSSVCLTVPWPCAHAANTDLQRPPPDRPTRIFTFDARPLNQLDLGVASNAARVWDTLHTFSALQGLVNREAPRLYLFYCSEFGVDTDQFWFDWLRGEDGWLKGAEIQQLARLEEVVRHFAAAFEGLVIYDPNVPATSNLASTAAGCENLLPVRYAPEPGSMFDLLVRRMNLPVKLWLVNTDGTSKFTGHGTIPDLGSPSSGSAKIDAYRWAWDRYVRTGKCARGLAAYYVDAYWLRHPGGNPTMHTLSNHDYFIARRAFFFDLSPWADEVPCDDPGQPLGRDRQMLLEMMRALYDHAGGGVLQVGGFVPWPYKYTRQSAVPGKHDGVPSEWEYGRLISQYNGFMEADAAGLGAMANASFLRHYPLAPRYPQPNRKPTLADWKTQGYVTAEGRVARRLFVGHYVGDYDAPSWLYKGVAAFFRDPARGQVPLGWAFDPNLADRAPQALAYAYRHATTNDFFIAGDSGAGYLNPRALTVRPDSGLPSGLEAWTQHCRKYYDRWDMSITGFMLDGSGGSSTDREFKAYQTFSPDGAGTHYETGPGLHNGLATCSERDLPDSVDEAVTVLSEAAARCKDHPGFFWARSILKSPRWYADLSRRLSEQPATTPVTFVDPYTFFGLIRQELSTKTPEPSAQPKNPSRPSH